MLGLSAITRREFLRKTTLTLLASSLVGMSLLTSCINEQPKPENPVKYTGIPRDVVEVIGQWKMGDYTEGFRIEFDDYYAITDGQGLLGQKGAGFGGPGLVPHSTVESFRKIADLCEIIKDKEEITIYGGLVKTKAGDDYRFNRKKVIYLHNVSYKNQFMEVNRRPWDN